MVYRRQLAWLTLAMLVATIPLAAQTSAADPVLRRRSYTQVEEEQDTGTRSTGRTLLPTDASGAYALGAGGMVELDLQPDRLSGFITRPGDRESDEGTPLTFFFSTSRLAGQRMAFTTRQVHGLWFSFDGTIVRGTPPNRGQPGYYLLQGSLVLHDAVTQTRQTRMVSLPLARQ